MSWMASNQLGRRNITESQKRYLLGKLYTTDKKIHGGDRKSEPVKSTHQNDELISETPKPIRNFTASKIAKENNVGEATVCRAEKFADAVDTLSETISPEVKTEILSCKTIYL